MFACHTPPRAIAGPDRQMLLCRRMLRLRPKDDDDDDGDERRNEGISDVSDELRFGREDGEKATWKADYVLIGRSGKTRIVSSGETKEMENGRVFC